jgi:protein TonB
MMEPMSQDQHNAFWPHSVRLALVICVSALLHAGIWQFRAYLDLRPDSLPQPMAPMEVTLTAAPPSAAPPSANTSPAPDSKPETQPKPKPALEKQKSVAKPKPKSKPQATSEAEVVRPPLPEPEPRPAPKVSAKETPSSTDSNTSVNEASAKPDVGQTRGSARIAETAKAEGSGSQAYEGPKVNAAYLHNPRPDYPEMAKRRQWEGKVILRVQVLASGRAGQVTIAGSSGHEILDEAALEAVRNWHFVPARRGDQPVDSVVNVPINFNLN